MNTLPRVACTQCLASLVYKRHMVACGAGLCQYINKFTRFSGELFGMLIAILFMQQAFKGVVQVWQQLLQQHPYTGRVAQTVHGFVQISPKTSDPGIGMCSTITRSWSQLHAQELMFIHASCARVQNETHSAFSAVTLPRYLANNQSTAVAHIPITRVLMQEFRLSACSDSHVPADDHLLESTVTADGSGCHEFSTMERLVNGLWATILAVGTVLTSVTILHARSWRFFKVPPPPTRPRPSPAENHGSYSHPSAPTSPSQTCRLPASPHELQQHQYIHVKTQCETHAAQ